MPKPRINRRNFLKTTAAAGAGLAAPAIVSSRVFGKNAPSNRLQMGCIGTGRMGHGDMRACLERGLALQANARIIAVCDVDRRRAEHAQAEIVQTYEQRLPQEPRPPVAIFEDFRDLLARDDIDGVTMSAPDHWHGLIAIAAAEAGKDIYLQKPLTYTIAEGRRLVEAVRRNSVILQTGSQQRSEEGFRKACELVRNGALGKLESIHVTLPVDHGAGRSTAMEVPSHLNYDLWLGPTPEVPYTEDRVHPQNSIAERPGWLQIEPYCRGMITGWGAHMFDIAQWGHGSDDSGPVEMAGAGKFPQRGLFNVHTEFQAEGQYADGVRLLAASGNPAGVKFVGEDGWIFVQRGQLLAEPAELLQASTGAGGVQLYVSHDHMLNFLECMRSRQDPVCPVEVGHRSNSVCVITHIAMKLGRALRWDPEAERFIDDEQANALLDMDYRAPWSL